MPWTWPAVGAWIAAFLAIVALVGIIGPWLASRAAMSDSNRAVNAVRDTWHKYVTKGWPVLSRLRLWRRVRVPDLAPAYVNKHMALFGRRHYLPGTRFQPTSYAEWNTGWAKLCELIDAYQVFVNNDTSLVVSKYWILIVGLLGRYGNRKDKGIVQKFSIRRDIEEERAPVNLSTMMEIEMSGTAIDLSSDFEAESSSGGSQWESDTTLSYKNDLELEEDEFGQMFAMDPEPLIYGTTGSFQSVGRQKGSWRHMKTVTFVPRAMGEIFSAEEGGEKAEAVSLETKFWIANGCLPTGVKADGKNLILSFEDLLSEDKNQQKQGLSMSQKKSQPQYFSLRKTALLPM
ncbi:hypothetical protein AJ80_06347 [Polytolypa hystricis UAMH7299]|uniref:Uncharacterized protein n=1 Tax=Polytolypa hystricis (strain UAMH7299) TaxID=1447883 RepID=A0A2B7XX38_POLH7|nr:hypothetical protein AJ80_06347 [Polytolypa hystricis UAMH7299]